VRNYTYTNTKSNMVSKPHTESLENALNSKLTAFREESLVDETLLPIAKLIKQTRENKNISQKTLAQKSGLTNVQLSRIESGKNVPSVKTLSRLGPYLGYSLEDLLLSSSYSGIISSDSPTYTDLEGKVINLYEQIEDMYKVDGELLLLFINFYSHYSSSDSELLKIMLQSIEECSYAKLPETNNKESPKCSNAKQYFIETFNNLKAFLFSLNKIRCSLD